MGKTVSFGTGIASRRTTRFGSSFDKFTAALAAAAADEVSVGSGAELKRGSVSNRSPSRSSQEQRDLQRARQQKERLITKIALEMDSDAFDSEDQLFCHGSDAFDIFDDASESDSDANPDS